MSVLSATETVFSTHANRMPPLLSCSRITGFAASMYLSVSIGGGPSAEIPAYARSIAAMRFIRPALPRRSPRARPVGRGGARRR